MPNIPDRYQVLIGSGQDFLKDRPLMEKHNRQDLMTIMQLLLGEVNEAIETIGSGDEVIEDKKVAIEQELADIGIFLLTAFEVFGSDMFTAIMEKHARNMLKYPAKLFSDPDGDYEVVTKGAKANWKKSGGNHDFYNGHSRYMIDFDSRNSANE